MDSLINSGQKKFLYKMAVYPSIAIKSMAGFLISVLMTAAAEVVVKSIFGMQINSQYILIGLCADIALLAVFIYTFVFYKSKLASTPYHALKLMTAHYANDKNWSRVLAEDATPEMLCDFFKVEYNKDKSNLLIVVAIVITLILYGLGFYNCSKEYKDTVERIEATQDAIESEFSEICKTSWKNDPREGLDYYNYYIDLERVEGDGTSGVDFTVDKAGKIIYVDYEYEFDEGLSIAENIDAANEWFAQIEEVLPNLKDKFSYEECATYKYKMSDDFRKQLFRKARKNNNESLYSSTNDGDYYVYESCSTYSMPIIRISISYYK